MPLVTVPNVIEQSDFSQAGWVPDGEDASVRQDGLQDVLNLLPDRNSGALVTRKGFRRLREELGGGLSSHYVRNVTPFRTSSTNYLIVVMSDGSASANNVRLYAITLSDMSVARIDTAGVTWTNPKAPHWGIGIDNIYYGGSRGNEMYSWDPDDLGWNAAAGTATLKEVIDDVNDDVDTTSEYGRDYAFTGKERVTYDGNTYSPNRSIRFDDWDPDDDAHYKPGDKVSHELVWDSVTFYYKSFKCIVAHKVGDVDAEPGSGGDWHDYWAHVRLPLPKLHGETTKSWDFVPVAAETSVATWWQSRLFMRYDDQGDKSRLLYSAPVKPDKGEDVPDVSWDPTDFAPGNDTDGAGGGWIAFNDGTHNGIINALHGLGNYLVVFKRRAVWVLTGSDDSSWTTRRLAEGMGAVGPQAVAELDGILYFLSDDGLYVTDGNEAREAPGNERVREVLRTRMDTALLKENQLPSLWAFGGFIWFSINDDTQSSGSKFFTYVYDPATGSFWKTNLPVTDVAIYRDEGITKLAFGAPLDYVARGDFIYQYDHASASDKDDTGADTYASADFTWNARIAWWPFSTLRQQRRIRRVWALVRSAVTQNVSIKLRQDYSDTVVATTTTSVAVTTPKYIEGQVIPDAHAISLELTGTKAAAAVLGAAVHTQPRRNRYHSG